jgi:hypothetical protein
MAQTPKKMKVSKKKRTALYVEISAELKNKLAEAAKRESKKTGENVKVANLVRRVLKEAV